MTIKPGSFPRKTVEAHRATQTRHSLIHAHQAVEALGWGSIIAPRQRLLGADVYPVVEVNQAAHITRKLQGQPPNLDQDTLAMWEWPEADNFRAPTVITLTAALSSMRAWRPALAGAARLRGLCSTAVLVDTPLGIQESECVLECKLRGVGVVEVDAAGGFRVVEPAQPGRAALTHRRTLDRWVEELLYQELIEAGLLDGTDPAPGSPLPPSSNVSETWELSSHDTSDQND